MIGRSHWFQRRKYSGWGLAPATWQGYLYIAVVIMVIATISALPLTSTLKMGSIFTVIGLLIADVLHIMFNLKLDEREAKIEALAERNASWTMVGASAALLIYFSTTQITLSSQEIMPFILLPMISGLVVKAGSNFLLQRSEL